MQSIAMLSVDIIVLIKLIVIAPGCLYYKTFSLKFVSGHNKLAHLRQTPFCYSEQPLKETMM